MIFSLRCLLILLLLIFLNNNAFSSDDLSGKALLCLKCEKEKCLPKINDFSITIDPNDKDIKDTFFNGGVSGSGIQKFIKFISKDKANIDYIYGEYWDADVFLRKNERYKYVHDECSYSTNHNSVLFKNCYGLMFGGSINRQSLIFSGNLQCKLVEDDGSYSKLMIEQTEKLNEVIETYKNLETKKNKI